MLKLGSQRSTSVQWKHKSEAMFRASHKHANVTEAIFEKLRQAQYLKTKQRATGMRENGRK